MRISKSRNLLKSRICARNGQKQPENRLTIPPNLVVSLNLKSPPKRLKSTRRTRLLITVLIKEGATLTLKGRNKDPFTGREPLLSEGFSRVGNLEIHHIEGVEEMTRTATTYNEVLGRDEHGSVIVLDEVFEYDYGFKGATGSRFEIVSREEVEEAIEPGNFEDYARELWQMEVSEGMTTAGLDEWIEYHFGTEEEKIESLYDSSYPHMHPAIREAFNVPEDAVINCTGGGRMFPGALEDLEWLPGQREKFEQVILDAEEA